MFKQLFRIGIALAILSIGIISPAPLAAEPQTRPVDVVFCLDVSGSMDELLNSTRARIWDVINELGRMKPTPELHVGLLSFGSESSSVEDGWVVKHTDMTSDLDTVYAQLMALSAQGSEEYVGRVLHEAVWNMNWSNDPEALKIVFIAGNESADKARESHDFRQVAQQARQEGIFINALYAGNREQGASELWPQIAQHGGGTFSAIDTSNAMQIATPQDEALLAANGRLVTTYLPYGLEGGNGLANQIAQDTNASRLGVQSCSSRIVAKGSALYNNAAWDLVDASLQEGFRLDDLLDSELPEAMRGMSADERLAFVAEKRSAREAIQLEIQKASAERENYIQAVMARERDGSQGLGSAMRDALCEQAVSKGFASDNC